MTKRKYRKGDLVEFRDGDEVVRAVIRGTSDDYWVINNHYGMGSGVHHANTILRLIKKQFVKEEEMVYFEKGIVVN